MEVEVERKVLVKDPHVKPRMVWVQFDPFGQNDSSGSSELTNFAVGFSWARKVIDDLLR